MTTNMTMNNARANRSTVVPATVVPATVVPATVALAAVELRSEFAAVRVSVDTAGRGVRLLVEDLESGDRIHLDALLLAAMCQSDDESRRAWLRTGLHRDEVAGS